MSDQLRLVAPQPVPKEEPEMRSPGDFTDDESQRTLTAKARSMAWALGYEAYRELRNGTAS